MPSPDPLTTAAPTSSAPVIGCPLWCTDGDAAGEIHSTTVGTAELPLVGGEVIVALLQDAHGVFVILTIDHPDADPTEAIAWMTVSTAPALAALFAVAGLGQLAVMIRWAVEVYERGSVLTWEARR